MFKKLLSYGVVGLLAVALLAGTVYILTRPAEAQAGQGQARAETPGRGDVGPRYGDESARGAPRNGAGRGDRDQGANTRSAGNSSGGVDWETVTGEVTAVDGEITVQTDDGQVVVGLGQSRFREEADFALEVGDEVSVTGFYEDGEFKAGTVENLTTGQTLALRDGAGRPIWAGRGQLKNQGRP